MARRNRILATVATLGTVLLISGCADRGQYPSLARRPAENAYRVPTGATPAPPVPAVMSDGMAARLEGLRNNAAKAHATFEGARGSATRAVSAARGAAKGSESWSVASVELARLESARAEAGLPLAELDRLETEASNRAVDGSDADLKAVLEARQEVEALVESETRVIDSLLAQLAG
ncbi:hypothetical protein [Novosphingobium taihuense]|uniref:Uncharacterized protein n=1 Tax=Novosphingobium taihuense TaxID=260085 RepID=A0A7W7ETB6_9SPHN|nr:hypothetical protein [Novosphingobium taihuense]MBB4613233.1 hypothetical protein [Novosphingobium taihuense]